ncbi:MAG: folate-binding protein [Terracidiphilus sp.]|jgi:folate-binding protein YgfZ
MTETDLTETLHATPLATLLETASKPHELEAFRLCAYRGVLTPRELDAPEKEIAALARGAAVHDLGWLKRVAVRGEDRFRWLSGMVTNTVNDLFPNSGAWNLVLNAQGRIQGDLTVWRGGEELSAQRRNPSGESPENGDRLLGTPFAGESGLELEIAADQVEKLLAHLNHFIIMDDVELVPFGEEQAGEAGVATAIGLTGPLANEVLERLGLPGLVLPMTATRVEWNGIDLRIERGYGVLAPHYVLWAPAARLKKLWSAVRTAGATPVGAVSLEAFRIAEAIPAYGIDILERDLPQETSQLRALHFNKGCYLGQEIVERIHSRGNVHRHLRALELSGPLPTAGTELTFEDAQGKSAAAGQIRSATELPFASRRRSFALGMIRGEAEQGNQPLTYSAGAATGMARILAGPPALAQG